MPFRCALTMLLAAVAALAAACASPVDTPTPSSAYSSWTPAPGAVDPAVTAVAADNCGFRPNIQTNPNGSQQPIVLPPPVLVDQRGKAAAALLVGENRIALCLLTDDGRGWTNSARSVKSVGNLRPFSAPLTVDALVTRQIGGTPTTGGQQTLQDGVLVSSFSGPGAIVTAVAGRVSPEVATIEVSSDGAPTVQASIKDGYFMAWWPQETDPLSISVLAYDEHGGEIAEWHASP